MFFWYAGYLLAALLAVALGVRFFGWCFRRIHDRGLARRAQGHLVLTYDDGPNSPATTQLADLLEGYGVTATFYLMGARAIKFPEICEMLRERRHDLGTHSFQHQNAWKVNTFTAIADIRKGIRTLAQWVSPHAFFRPPYGKITLFTWLAAKCWGVRMIGWSLDSKDTARQLPEVGDTVQRFVTSGGGVVLLHCHHVDPERLEYMLTLTEALITVARDRKWRICTVTELIGTA